MFKSNLKKTLNNQQYEDPIIENFADPNRDKNKSTELIKYIAKQENLQKTLNIQKPQLKNTTGFPSFDFSEMPNAYFADNAKGLELRKQLVVNQLKLSQCNVGELETTFFSKDNIDLINKQLILSVFYRTNKQFLICPQKESDLIIVMRYVFLEHARNLPFDIKGQVRKLNCKVVGEILPTVISNSDQKIGYLRDINTQPIGPPLPVNTKKTNRTLPTSTQFF
jgi:hypothetical protein